MSVVQVLDGTLYTPTGWTTTERIATPPVLAMVTLTIGIGQYGGGVEGKLAVAGVSPKVAVSATVVVVRTGRGGGFVAGALVDEIVRGGAVRDGAVVAPEADAVDTGSTNVVVGYVGAVVSSDDEAMGLAARCTALADATTLGVPLPAKAQLVTATTPSTKHVTTPTTTSQCPPRTCGTGSVSVRGSSTPGYRLAPPIP
jgi:hypothetical protein